MKFDNLTLKKPMWALCDLGSLYLAKGQYIMGFGESNEVENIDNFSFNFA